MNRSATAVRCLSGSAATAAHSVPVDDDGRRGDSRLGQLFGRGHRRRPARPRADVVDGLAVGDREQPTANVGRIPQLRVGAQGRQPRLLVAVVGVDGAHGGDQESVHVAAVRVEEGLERWQAHDH